MNSRVRRIQCRVFAVGLAIVLACLLLVAPGVVCLLADLRGWQPAAAMLRHCSHSVLAGASMLATGLFLPVLCLVTCVWCSRPGERASRDVDFRADGLLEEQLTPQHIERHFDTASPPHPTRPPVILLHDVGASRAFMHPISDRLSIRHATLCVDLPGHGTLAEVPFSLARCAHVVRGILKHAVAEHEPALLVAYGRAAPIAVHVATQLQHRVCGIVLAGPMPDPDASGGCAAFWAGTFRLSGVQSLARSRIRWRLSRSRDLLHHQRHALLRAPLHLDALPVWHEQVAETSPIDDFATLRCATTIITPDPTCAFVSAARQRAPPGSLIVLSTRDLRRDFYAGRGLDGFAARIMEAARRSSPPPHARAAATAAGGHSGAATAASSATVQLTGVRPGPRGDSGAHARLWQRGDGGGGSGGAQGPRDGGLTGGLEVEPDEAGEGDDEEALLRLGLGGGLPVDSV